MQRRIATANRKRVPRAARPRSALFFGLGCAAFLLLSSSSCAPPPRNTVKGEPPPPANTERSQPARTPLPPEDLDDLRNMDLPRAADTVEPELIVAAARQYEGTPYRYGGESGAGMDCSGLVFRVFTDHDVTVPRTTEEQFRLGRSVPLDRLRPGDLVFFDDGRGRIQHVGLIVGGDRFLHASTSRRRVVEDSLRQSYFRDRFAGARRIIGH